MARFLWGETWDDAKRKEAKCDMHVLGAKVPALVESERYGSIP